jgi:hypothetical protein
VNRRALSLFLLAGYAAAACAQDYTFDISAYEVKPFTLGGHVELRQERLELNRSGAFYGLNFPDGERRALDRTTGALELAGKYQRDRALFNFRTRSSVRHDQADGDTANRLYEGYLSLRPYPGLTVDAGKQVLGWGKGYAFNPVGFLQRPKDPLEPELAREGYTLLTADWIRTFDGPLQAVTFSPVLLPVTAEMNRDFGPTGHLNPAARLYLLYRDIDIDVMYLARGSRSPRLGVDFAYNLRTNFAIHGEWTWLRDVELRTVDPSGGVASRRADVRSYLLGLRYLSARETTTIVEYYRNGLGRSEAEMQAFFSLVGQAGAQFAATGDGALLGRARNLSAGYGGFAPMRSYVYVRVSQKEPFDILYFTPSVMTIFNVDDHSYNLTGELLYRGIANVDLRLRAGFLQGGSGTEYGEKQNRRRFELMARYYF